MYRCIIWGTGLIFQNNINIIKFYEVSGIIQISGVTSNDIEFCSYFGYSHYKKEELKQLDFDLIIVMTTRKVYQEICEEAKWLGIEDNKIVSWEVLKKPNLDLKKYMQLKQNPPTIFTNFCWGGLTYHDLYLPFQSPFINIRINDKDYMKFLKNPRYYIEQPIILKEYGWESQQQIRYPICMCGDIRLDCLHSVDYEKVRKDWECRKERIDWNNLFVMMITTNKTLVREFSKLPYNKKMCFAPFEIEERGLDSVCYLKQHKKWQSARGYFVDIVNEMAMARIMYYDPVTLLCDGKIIKLMLDNISL